MESKNMQEEQYKIINVVPTKIPFRCVVCNGFGSLKYGTITCQGCDGKGYVVVKQDGNIDASMD